MGSEPRRIGVVGPGLMGLGLCHAAAACGLEVVLAGRDEAAARRGHARLSSDLAKRVARGKLDAQARDRILAAVQVAADDRALEACGLVVESVVEERAAKVEVLRRIEGVVGREALIATNTSGLPIGGLAESLQRPGRFIGLHFFSPVDRMALVEVVVGPATAASTVEAALDWTRRLGKRPVVVRDGPGFFTSRVFAAYLDEAAAMVGEGVDPASIEAAAMAFGMPLGPLAMLDETGLALNRQQALQARADGLPERFCRPLAWPVLDKLVALGRTGRRDGAGFHDYPPEAAKVLWQGLESLFPRCAPQPDAASVMRRLSHAQAMEALRCLEEGTIAQADDADAASLLGLGFPKSRGGVLADVERLGLARFVDECDALADAASRARDPQAERFRPSPWLRARVDRERPFDR